MIRKNQSVAYEAPRAEVINLELEQAVLIGSGYDPEGTGRDPMEG